MRASSSLDRRRKKMKEEEEEEKLHPASIHSMSIPRGNGAIRDFIQLKEKRFSHHNPHTPPSSTARSQISSTQTQILFFFLIITQFPNFSPLPKLLRTHRRE
jgi:hypothetical protein